MQLHALHLDDALKSQAEFLAKLNDAGAQTLHLEELGARVRLWSTFDDLSALERNIADFMADHRGANDTPHLWFMGSGDFHHVSALLQRLAIEQQAEAVTVVHFDNHPDWVLHTHNVHCGSWVNRSAAMPKIAKIITVGVTSGDLVRPEAQGANLALLRDGKLELFVYDHAPSVVRGQYGSGAGHVQANGHLHWHNMVDFTPDAFAQLLLSRIATPMVYLTIDKDVLARTDAITNWDQGGLRLPQLLDLIRAIGKRHRILGADVTGDYSPPRYRGDTITRLRKYGEILLDQPWRAPSPTDATAINQTGNLALLATLQEVMG